MVLGARVWTGAPPRFSEHPRTPACPGRKTTEPVSAAMVDTGSVVFSSELAVGRQAGVTACCSPSMIAQFTSISASTPSRPATTSLV